MMAAQTRRTKRTKRKSTHVRAKILARARAAVRPMTTAAKARTLAKARAAAQPMGQKCQMINPSRSRTKAPQPQWVGVECPDPLFPLGKLLYASKSFQWVHGPWNWDRPSRAS